MPAYFRSVHPSFLTNVIISGVNVPVRIGKATVMPGDLVFGDAEGVYFIPPALVQKVMDNADEVHVHDEWTRKKFDEGKYKSARDLRHAQGPRAEEGIRGVPEEAARGDPQEEPAVNDVRLAARSLRRSPGFLAVALVTMAIGIGVSTALFSVVNGVLLRPLPYPQAERLVALYTTNAARHQRTGAVSYADFADWRAQSRSFDAMAAYHASGAVLGGPEPLHVPAARVSAGFFDVFGGSPRARARVRDARRTSARRRSPSSPTRSGSGG